MNKQIEYDPAEDFAPVASIARNAWLIAISHMCRSNDPEFVAYSRANPGKAQFGCAQGTARDPVADISIASRRRYHHSLQGRRTAHPRLAGRPHPGLLADTLRRCRSFGRQDQALATPGLDRNPELPDDDHERARLGGPVAGILGRHAAGTGLPAGRRRTSQRGDQRGAAIDGDERQDEKLGFEPNSARRRTSRVFRGETRAGWKSSNPPA